MNWVVKAISQKIISFLPFSDRINYYCQRYFSVGPELSKSFVLDKINHANSHLKNFDNWNKTPLEKAKIMEFGTGWYPIVPVVFFLSGCNDIITVDIRKLYTKQSVNQALQAVLVLVENENILNIIPTIEYDRITILKQALKENNLSAKLSLLNISTLLYSKAEQTLKNVDLLISNNTLQFLDRNQLELFCIENKNILSASGILSLAIDFTDEFSHSDKRLSQFNFLKYSPFQWKLITNRLNAPKRLRYIDFQKELASNFTILNVGIITGKEDELNGLIIHKAFSHYTKDDLIIKHAYIVCSNTKSVSCEKEP